MLNMVNEAEIMAYWVVGTGKVNLHLNRDVNSLWKRRWKKTDSKGLYEDPHNVFVIFLIVETPA